MSSFQYSDNFSGFNDLINRVEFLQEKDWKSMVKSGNARKEFKKYTAPNPKTGIKEPPGGLSRLANILFTTALGELHLGIIDSKTSDTLKKAAYATSSTRIAKALKELAPKAFEELFRDKNPRSVEVSEYVNNPENMEELIKDTVINFTRKDREYIKDVDPEDLADAVEDTVEDISKEMEEIKDQLPGLPDELDVRFDTLPDKDNIIAKMVDRFNQIRPNIKASPMSGGTGFTVEGPVGAFDNINDKIIDNILGISPHAKKDDINIQVYSSADEDFEQSLYGDEEDSYEENELPSSTQEEEEVDDLIMNNDKEAFILTVTDSVKRALKKALDRYGILFNDVEEGLTVAIEDEQIATKLKTKINGPREDEEFRESYTGGYMSDQSSSDKRNKKKEVLSESFKDRYKPKTHWQLGELKRYGL
jgi:hypothetical protein